MSSSHRVLVTTSNCSVSAEANDCGKGRYSVSIVDSKREGEKEGDEICCSADELQLLASSRSASYY